jgi:hypothetical protein
MEGGEVINLDDYRKDRGKPDEAEVKEISAEEATRLYHEIRALEESGINTDEDARKLKQLKISLAHVIGHLSAGDQKKAWDDHRLGILEEN